MYIKLIVIDGFKSYAHRTEIGPFDPMFNAITGLNGSGKSNILDAICFLLGISNLSQVRAGTLQELVYKSGQAGVTKATVTITFDNSDKDQSPIGYQSHSEITVSRQVVIGGRNKYLINGSNAPPPRVQDLFRSVQLNVNNPHFLIMQGRITKVLNMKPPEILAMIEEAAGTRMYESKRTAAQKTIGKKDAKLKEIETILEEEITPTLRRLREERSSYLEYQKVSRELEHLNRLTLAHHFVQAEDWRKQAAMELDQAKQEIAQLQQQLLQSEETLVRLSVALDELQERRRQEAQGPVKDQEKKVEECMKELTLAESTLKHSKELLTREKRANTALLKSLNEDEALLQSKKSEVEGQHESHQELMKRVKETESAVTAAQKHFQAVSAGLSSSADGQEQTLAAQKIARENEISTAQTQIKQAEMRLKSTVAEIKEKESASRSSERDYAKDKAMHDRLQADISRKQGALDDLQYQEGQEEALIERKEAVEAEIAQLSHKIDGLGARFRITYKDPVSGFDRSRVKGIVGRLVRVKDLANATALEVAAGGRLYQLVVDTETTSRLLLDNGKLSRRSTIIILNKITPRTIPDAVVRKAKTLVGGDSVHTALSLVDSEEEYWPAVQYVFGSYLVSNTLQEAKTVTFDKGVLTSCVSLSGDVFNPSGTLTGGSRPRSSAVLVQLQELADCEEQLEAKQVEFEQLKSELKQVHQVARKYQQIKEHLDVMVHDAHMVWARMEGSTHHQQLVHLQQLKDSAQQLRETLSLGKETECKAKEQLKDIHKKLEDAQGHRQRELQEAEDGLSKAQHEAEQATSALGNRGQEMATLELEVEELEKSIASQQEQVSESSQNIVNLSADVEQRIALRNEKKALLSEVQEELNRLRAAMKKTNKELQQVEAQQKEMEKAKSEMMLQGKEAEHKVAKCEKDSRAAASKVESMLSHYEWIASDRQYFGQPNTAYDFQATNPKEAQRKIGKLQEQKDQLGKSVNMRAMNMLGKVEEKYNDLMKKKTIVEKDKAKIAELIEELDQKKKEALETAWKKVNKDFGSIFSMLLPGTMAKLAQPEGQQELTGLEVKVAFGAVWKENLTELSGGQRSLVALSLILSLLLFKPAPLYILDEVDAALDLSHTQNIGHMLRTHFGHSQFIVVSLKDGMFNNANVLFKTKFVDGVSTVTRYVNPRSGEVPSTSQKENERRLGGHPLGQSTRSKRPRKQGLAADL